MNILEVNSINKHFGGLHAVNNVSFTIKKGIIKSIIGPNGAGKSTLFNLISGIHKSDSGTVKFKESFITNLKSHKIAYQGISRTFQTIRLFPKMSVLENVMVGMHTKSKAGFFSGLINSPLKWKEERMIVSESKKVLELLKIDDVADFEATNLPFGKQRLVELARALVSKPDLLLLDEPASGLNIHETKEFGEAILNIKKMGITVLLVEHDMSLVMEISDEIVVLSYGQKIAEGDTLSIRKNPEVIKIYLGEDNA